MTRQQLINYCLTFADAVESYPFESIASRVWTVIRHRTSNRGFAHIYERDGNLCVNLKCDPYEADFFRQIYDGVSAAYHMNKTHWNTLYLDGNVPDEVLMKMLDQSHQLIFEGLSKKMQEELLDCADG